jgi:hypothetical protein
MKITKNFIVGLMASTALLACQKEEGSQTFSTSDTGPTPLGSGSTAFNHDAVKNKQLLDVLVSAGATLGKFDTIRIPAHNANMVLSETRNSDELALQFHGLTEDNEIEFRIVDNKTTGSILTFVPGSNITIDPDAPVLGDSITIDSVIDPVASHQTIRLLSVVPVELEQLLAEIDGENA